MMLHAPRISAEMFLDEITQTAYEYPACMDALCKFQGCCTNHINNVNLRKGWTPKLREIVGGSWRCDQKPENNKKGALLIDDTYLCDRDEAHANYFRYEDEYEDEDDDDLFDDFFS